MSEVSLKDVEIREEDGSYVVCPIWDNVDRPYTGGTSTGENLALAKRLKRAVEDYAVFDDLKVKTDVNGNTYVSSFMNVRGRRLNADLNRLGY